MMLLSTPIFSNVIIIGSSVLWWNSRSIPSSKHHSSVSVDTHCAENSSWNIIQFIIVRLSFSFFK